MKETPEVAARYIIYEPPVRSGSLPVEKRAPLDDATWLAEVKDISRMFRGDEENFTPIEKAKVMRAGPAGEPAVNEIASGQAGESSAAGDSKGGLLNQDTFLKEDRYPGLKPGPNGEPPNYRTVGGSHGMAQPTVDEIRTFLDTKILGESGSGKKKVLWANLREEPVVYIKGKPYTLRSFAAKGKNLETPGVSGADVEAKETLLKEEVKKSLHRNGEGKLVIETFRETGWDKEKGEPILEKVETVVDESDIQTPREVFENIGREYKERGLEVDLKRIPITDEKKPEPGDIDELIGQFREVDSDTEVVFNCQAGRGRTTTAMTIYDILNSAKSGDSKFNKKVHEDIRENSIPGYYRMALSVIRRINGHFENSRGLDGLVDGQARGGGADLANPPKEISKDPAKARDFLERYYTLYQVYQYAEDQAPDYSKSFSEWIKAADPEGKKKAQITASLGLADVKYGQGNSAYA